MKKQKLFIIAPKNKGLRQFKDIVLSAMAKLPAEIETILVRGEDIPIWVRLFVSEGKKAIGITGEDLFANYVAGGGAPLNILYKIPWYNKNAIFKRPVLCLLGLQNLDLKKIKKIAVNSKYLNVAETYLKQKKLKVKIVKLSGSTEYAITNNLVDAAIDIVNTGETLRSLGLKVYAKIVESNIVVVGGAKDVGIKFKKVLRPSKLQYNSKFDKIGVKMKKTFAVPRGARDFLPDEMSKRKYVEAIVKKVFESFGFQQIQTPIFEEFDLFAARSGEEIREGMFTFVSDEKEYALRPELTAAVCRLITTGKITIPKPYEIYYVGSCFRYERPQSGRYREFSQAGLELMGSASPIADAKVIAVATSVLKKFGMKNYRLKIGNIGVFRNLLQEKGFNFDMQTRIIRGLNSVIELREKLAAIASKKSVDEEDLEFIKSKINEAYELQEKVNYSGEFEISPVTKVDAGNMKKFVEELPKFLEETNKLVWSRDFKLDKSFIDLLLKIAKMQGSRKEVESTARQLLEKTSAKDAINNLFEVLNWLEKFGVTNYTVVLGVARGLDFYTGTVFELDCPALGAQKQICGGGRYDNLVEEFGGPRTPATGFAYGFDRLVEALEKSGINLPITPKALVYVATINNNMREKAIEIAQMLREKDFSVCEDLLEADFRKQLESANKLGVKYVVIIGPKELEMQSATVKNMETQRQQTVKIFDLPSMLK